MAVELGPKRRERRAEEQRSRECQIPRSRDRQLRWLALALHIEDLVLSGQAASYAEIARICGVSRARVNQLVNGSGLAHRTCSVYKDIWPSP